MRLGRSISAVAGGVTSTLVGLFLMVSPWVSGIETRHQSWSLATKTDFWSGLGVLVVGLATILLYRASVSRELETAGVVSRTPRLEGSAAPESAPAPAAMTDEALLALAASVVKDAHEERMQPVPGPAAAHQAVATPAESPISEEELVRLASALLTEIQHTPEPPAPQEPPAQPAGHSSEPAALMSEAELVKMATSLLEEIQAARQAELVRVKGEGSHE